MPKVSVIMGAYNAQDTIKKCIESIIEQSFVDWEFIICNDCSNDNTEYLIKEYIKKDKRIILINNKENLRLAASLNKCLKYCKGEYIARMDADDISAPDRIMKQVEFLDANAEIAVVGTNRIIFDENGYHGIRKSIEYPTEKFLLRGAPFAHPTIMMRKKVYLDLGGYTVSEETVRAEDLELWFRFFANGYKGYNLQENLYYYHESENDLKKRTISAGVQTAKVQLKGCKLIGFPRYSYVLALKPIVSALIPNKIMTYYHRAKLLKKE